MLTFIVSCKHKDKNKFDETVPKTHQELYGNWVGDFEAKKVNEGRSFSNLNKLNLKITSINTNNQVEGLSIVAGNKVPFVGTYDDATKKFVLKEIGKNKYNGVFEFSIVSEDSIEGLWNANDTTITVYQRSLSLHKKTFVYNKNLMLPEPEDDPYMDYTKGVKKKIKADDSTEYTQIAYRSASDAVIKINASNTELVEDSLKYLKKLDLQIIRNTIYARHGYTFSSRVARQFFDWVDWYMPVSNDVEKDLTPLEVKNIALLKRFEKYAEDNYDTFGR
jgi:hypothetical protein